MRTPNTPTPAQWREGEQQFKAEHMREAAELARELIEAGTEGGQLADLLRDQSVEFIRTRYGVNMHTGKWERPPKRRYKQAELMELAAHRYKAEMLHFLAQNVRQGIKHVQAEKLTPEQYGFKIFEYWLLYLDGLLPAVVYWLHIWGDAPDNIAYTEATAAVTTYARTRVKLFPRVRQFLQNQQRELQPEEAFQEALFYAFVETTGGQISPGSLAEVPRQAEKQLAKEAYKASRMSTLPDEFIEQHGEEDKAYRAFEQRELFAQTAKEAGLTEEQIEIVQLMDLDAFPESDVAERLDLPIGTVRSRHARAKQKLKKY